MKRTSEASITLQVDERTFSENLTKIAKQTNQFDSYILFESNGQTVNGKSILGLSSFMTPSRSVILRAVGEDSKEAVEEIKKLLLT
ncbi:HPr family phosphocarrier protein [Salsuginibacillus kocurii]|uniref:HPr family phosphocarrier protein n=1 Tax=Salsuginibacillus kocurii TaxID=427078 RepID=UPI000365C8CB|nr:HPr family phosphocarrier protein [Salsuginibacillus kocurii]